MKQIHKIPMIATIRKLNKKKKIKRKRTKLNNIE